MCLLEGHFGTGGPSRAAPRAGGGAGPSSRSPASAPGGGMLYHVILSNNVVSYYNVVQYHTMYIYIYIERERYRERERER